jgi:hypothetical protein
MARKKKALIVKTPVAIARAKRSIKGGDTTAQAKSTKPPRNKGVTSGMKIMEHQDHTLEINHKSDKRLSDIRLADNWAVEFPQSECMQRRDTSIVKSVRRLYNKGTHRSNQAVPTRPSIPYNDEGQPVEGREGKKTVAKAA